MFLIIFENLETLLIHRGLFFIMDLGKLGISDGGENPGENPAVAAVLCTQVKLARFHV